MTRSLAGGRRAEATVLPTWVKPPPPIARPAARRVGIATRNQFDEYRMHARLDRGVVRLLTARVRLDAQIPGRSPRRWRRFPPGKPISTGSWAAFNRMAQPSFSLLQSASDSGNSENLIFLLFDLPPARWRNRRREPARKAEGAAPYPLVGCAALAKATHVKFLEDAGFWAGTRFGQVRALGGSGSVRRRVSRCCGAQDCTRGAASQDFAV